MALSARRNANQNIPDAHTMYDALFPSRGLLETTEQIRRFELLRLAFFALKLRKMERRSSGEVTKIADIADRVDVVGVEDTKGREGLEGLAARHNEQEFRRNLLRHVIFQQVLTLIRLDARDQAMQIIATCHK